jgi:hypothetical protein
MEKNDLVILTQDFQGFLSGLRGRIVRTSGSDIIVRFHGETEEYEFSYLESQEYLRKI